MSESKPDLRKKVLEADLRQLFDQSLEARVARALMLPHHAIIPNHHFAAACAECADLWRDGYFIAVIMMSQALVEGISRFIRQKHNLATKGEPLQGVKLLRDEKKITESCADAMMRICNSFRNDVHHMNPAIAGLHEKFQEIAYQNMQDLRLVESEVFAFDFVGAKIRPRNPLYWDLRPDGTAEVFLRMM